MYGGNGGAPNFFTKRSKSEMRVKPSIIRDFSPDLPQILVKNLSDKELNDYAPPASFKLTNPPSHLSGILLNSTLLPTLQDLPSTLNKSRLYLKPQASNKSSRNPRLQRPSYATSGTTQPLDTLVHNLLKSTVNASSSSREGLLPSSMLHDIVLREPGYLRAQGKPREYIQRQRVRVKVHRATEERAKRARGRAEEVEERGEGVKE